MLLQKYLFGYQFYYHLIRYNIYMRLILLSLLVVLGCCDNWAVLIAGSNTYSNYRHQADVYHAYQAMIKGGFDPSRIITFAYDDIASHLTNPFRGKVFNKPTYKDPGVDVYSGVKIDYSKLTVTPEHFLAVLEGNKSAVAGKGTGRVVQSTSEDNIFIFFSDHGAPGLIAFPHSNLYADKLISSFSAMKGKYKRVVFYLEACESGSMFAKLPNNTGIYALSAANPSESSWGCYCSPDDVVSGKHIGSCLGDLFSVNFLEDTDKGNYDQTLNQQFDTIKRLTNKSHVMQWGDMSFADMKIGEFLTGTKYTRNSLRFIRPVERVGRKVVEGSFMDSRTMKIQSLAALYAREHSAELLAQMAAEMQSMQKYENVFNRLSKALGITGDYDPKKINFECLRATVEGFQAKCEKFSDYGLSFIKYLAHGCETLESSTILDSIQC